MYSPLIGHPLCAREVLYLHVFILSFLFLENYAIRSLFYPNTIYTLPPGCSQVRGQSMMLTQPVKSGMLLAHSPPRPHPGSLSAQRNCGGVGGGVSPHPGGPRCAPRAATPQQRFSPPQPQRWNHAHEAGDESHNQGSSAHRAPRAGRPRIEGIPAGSRSSNRAPRP